MKPLFRILISSILAFFAGFYFVSAHGEKYLEFDPDDSDSLKVTETEAPAQTFTAQNDFLGGFDIWASNDGPTGSVIFQLLNEQGNIISTRSLAVPTIPEINGGTRFHVDFPSQFAVTSYKKYTIKIVSPPSDFKLHYSDRVKLVSYNAPFVSEYVTGVGKLGAEEQTFSFKYALYEGVETSAPVISNVVWTALSGNEMRVEFNVNEPVDYRVEYGIAGAGYLYNTGFSGGYTFCTVGVAKCSLIVPVYPNTEYQYSLTVKDSWNNQSQFSGSFVSSFISSSPSPAGSPVSTPAASVSVTPSATVSVSPSPTESGPLDADSPIISDLRIAEKTDKSVDIAWTTNEAASSRLLISFTTELYTIAEISDSTFELEHLLKTGLTLNPSTTYLATITSHDVANNVATASINFTTLSRISASPSPEVTPPVPAQSGDTSQLPSQSQESLITVTSSPSLFGQNLVFVEWPDSYPGSGGGSGSGYRVDILDESGNLVETVSISRNFSKAEVKNIPNGNYSVIVYKKNNNGTFEKIDRPTKLAIAQESFIEKLQSVLPYLVAVLGALIFLAWRLFKKHSLQTS